MPLRSKISAFECYPVGLQRENPSLKIFRKEIVLVRTIIGMHISILEHGSIEVRLAHSPLLLSFASIFNCIG